MQKLLLALIVLVAGGCASTRTYNVVLRNRTLGPVTVGFVKDGPVFEERWASPEALSNLPPSRMPAHWGMTIQRGETKAISVAGKFNTDTHGFVRVYLGTPSASQLLAMSEGMGDRLQMVLSPQGDNDFVVEEENGRLVGRLRRFAGQGEPPPRLGEDDH
jgi:hypothetical protein